MNQTEADLKLMIATIESVEQHLDLIRKAIAHDAVSKDECYFHVFQGLIEDLSGCRDKLKNISKAIPAFSSSNSF